MPVRRRVRKRRTWSARASGGTGLSLSQLLVLLHVLLPSPLLEPLHELLPPLLLLLQLDAESSWWPSASEAPSSPAWARPATGWRRWNVRHADTAKKRNARANESLTHALTMAPHYRVPLLKKLTCNTVAHRFPKAGRASALFLMNGEAEWEWSK